MSDKELPEGSGCLIALVATLILWALILAAFE